MQPFLLISAIVASYMCIVQGPCRNQNWLKHGSRQYILSRLRYRDNHDNNHHHDNNLRYRDSHEHDDRVVHVIDDTRGNDYGNRDGNYRDRNFGHGRNRDYLRESSCKTPSGEAGNCISLYDCQPLMNIINKSDKSRQDVDLLRKSQCGFQGQTPKVCCPAAADNACFTPDAQPGQCVNLYSCPHIANMLTPPVPQETVTFVQNSRCQGPDQYSVCCGPPRTTNQPPVKTGVCTSSVAPPDPRSKCCGVDASAADKIVGGNETTVDQYPWMVIIEYVKTSAIKLLCGGALISGKYVLTAGHCVAGPVLDIGTPRNVRLSEYDTSNDVKQPDCAETPGGGTDCTEGVIIIPIEKVIPHPDYNPSHALRRNDIALLRLRSLAPYNDFVRPICLPISDLSKSSSANQKLFVAGWGAVSDTLSKSNIKLHVDVPMVSRGTCQPAYSVPRRNVQLWDGQLCAGGEKGKDSCKGDSGGPLMYENIAEKRWEVVGIVSFGPTPCGAEDIPGVYTKVHHYLPWIRSQIKP